MKVLFKFIKKVIFSAFLLYGYNLLAAPLNFIIPIYENMPQEISKKPQKDSGVDTSDAEQVRLNVNTSINLRATPNGEVIGLLYGYNLIAVNFNMIIPINVITILSMCFLGMPSLLALLLFKLFVM